MAKRLPDVSESNAEHTTDQRVVRNCCGLIGVVSDVRPVSGMAARIFLKSFQFASQSSPPIYAQEASTFKQTYRTCHYE